MHCSQLTKSTIAGWKKKKTEEHVEKNVDVGFSSKQTVTRTTIILETKYELPFRFIEIVYVYFTVKSLF